MISKHHFYALFLSLIYCSCGTNTSEEKTKDNPISVTQQAPSETQQMVDELKSLVTTGDANRQPYWNRQRADIYRNQLSTVDEAGYNQLYYNYCKELLLAGESRNCITEIETYLGLNNTNETVQISDANYIFFELLALSYLRLGEQENCQNAHTEFSCILPLKDPAIHQLEEGSRKAIEIYDIIQTYYPQEKYKWLINLAYMTLGEQAPEKYKIDFPNWELEQKNFPRFNEISMNVGLAENGLSGGTSVDDFNGDGLLDVFATSSGMNDQVKLFFNTGNGDFKDVTNDAGLTGILGGLNCIHADYDNDGFKDILVLRGGWLAESGKHPNSLLKKAAPFCSNQNHQCLQTQPGGYVLAA